METPQGTIAYSLTVSEFKQRNDVSEISIKQVPERDTRFWTAGELSGPVSSKCDLGLDLQFAIMADNGVAVLCNAGTGVNVLATL